MKSSADIERKDAFILDADSLCKIASRIESIGDFHITVNCADGVERRFDSLDEAIAFENSTAREIQILQIGARSEDWQTSIKLRFRESSLGNINITCEGSDEFVTSTLESISEIVDGLMPWYGRISRFDFWYPITFVWFGYFGYLMSKVRVKDSPSDESASTTEFLDFLVVSAVVIGALVFPFLASSAINKLRSNYFPIAEFALGQGVRRLDVKEKVRWTIVIGFIVSVVASVIVGLVV